MHMFGLMRAPRPLGMEIWSNTSSNPSATSILDVSTFTGIHGALQPSPFGFAAAANRERKQRGERLIEPSEALNLALRL